MTDLKGASTVILLTTGKVRGEHGKSDSASELRCIADDERILPISETTGQRDFGAGPFVRLFGDAKMKSALGIRPGVGRTVLIHSVAAVAGCVTDSPFI